MKREDLGHWGRLQASPNVKNTKYMKVLFIDKINYATRSGVSSIAVPYVFDRMQCIRSQTRVCIWSCAVRSNVMRSVQSIAHNYLRVPTAQVLKRWRLGPAKATRGLRLSWLMLDRGSCIRSHQVRSSALERAKISTLLNFSHLSHNLHQGPSTH